MFFSEFGIKNLFPTPFVTASFTSDTTEALNNQLIATILEREKENPQGVRISNAGGWQSDDKLLEWGGEPVQTILASLKDLINQVTFYLEGATYKRVAIDWRINGWANINRKGNSNLVHTHPGSYWSAVYYVLIDEEQNLGGELEIVDPRGVLPIMYCPHLRFGIKGYTSAGTSELHKPKAGECILFPSWLPHAVRTYIGEGTRISLAFNFAV